MQERPPNQYANWYVESTELYENSVRSTQYINRIFGRHAADRDIEINALNMKIIDRHDGQYQNELRKVLYSGMFSGKREYLSTTSQWRGYLQVASAGTPGDT